MSERVREKGERERTRASINIVSPVSFYSYYLHGHILSLLARVHSVHVCALSTIHASYNNTIKAHTHYIISAR